MISIDDFKKIEIRTGKILSAEKVEGSEKLLKLSVDFGGVLSETSSPSHEKAGFGGVKQVISGIAKYISPEDLVGTVCAFVTNLEPREIMGLKSEAMIMAVSHDSPTGELFSLLKVSENIPLGSIVK